METAFYHQQGYFPWFAPYWQKLIERKHRFPHAILMHGLSGLGKKHFAFYLAKALLCRSPMDDGQPCHQCRACQLFSSGNHPDFKWLTPLEGSKNISVDSIRESINWTMLSSQMEGKKILLIEPAETMNINASNSLLKTLEEPADDTVIILLSHQLQALAATIRSRCQQLTISLPNKKQSLTWLSEKIPEEGELLLSLAGGAPLKALTWFENNELSQRESILEVLFSIHLNQANIFESAAKLVKIEALKVLYWFDSLLVDCIRISHKVPASAINNIDKYQDLLQTVSRINIKNTFQLYDLIRKSMGDIKGQINYGLIIETLLLNWQKCRLQG